MCRNLCSGAIAVGHHSNPTSTVFGPARWRRLAPARLHIVSAAPKHAHPLNGWPPYRFRSLPCRLPVPPRPWPVPYRRPRPSFWTWLAPFLSGGLGVFSGFGLPLGFKASNRVDDRLIARFEGDLPLLAQVPQHFR